jgi:shikimate kinase
MDTPYVITIGREFGSGGHQIGQLIAQRLGITFFDRELIEEASRRSGMSADFLERADEKAPSLLDYALHGGFGSENVLSGGNFYVLQANVISSLAKEQSCVIVGRSADYILRDHPRIVNIFIHAPKAYRQKNVAEREHISQAEALALIEKQDKQRSKFYNFYSDKVWGKSSSYHISVDASLLGMERTVDHLITFIQEVLAK